MLIFGMNYFADIFFRLCARNHNLTSALFAPDSEIHSRTQNVKAVAAARMILFHYKLVAHANVHIIAPFVT